MSLSAAAKQRYQRQILLGEIGEQGQERLLRTGFGRDESCDTQAYATSADYLRRAGCVEDPGAEPARVPSAEALDTFAGGKPRYREAARTILGALSAVEFLKRALSLPEGAELPQGLALVHGETERRP